MASAQKPAISTSAQRRTALIRIILVYGIIAGIIASTSYEISGLTNPLEHTSLLLGAALGYLVMLIGLTFVFVGVRKYRDDHLGGIIRFSTALGVGIAIAAVASFMYVIGWELHLYLTDYAWISSYVQSTVEAARTSGASAAEIAAVDRQMHEFAASYSRPGYRMMLSFSEIAPVALIVPLIAAALLRKSTFLPATAAASRPNSTDLGEQ